MLLTANIGNSIISFGFFDDRAEMVASFDVSCDVGRTSDEYLAIIHSIAREKGIQRENTCGAILSSVVPPLTETIRRTVTEFWGVTPLLVGPGVKTGFHIKIDNPSELGGDMVANTAAAIRLKTPGHATIVADLGLVNTLSAVSRDGDFLGCAIYPGIELSLNSLRGEAAQLPTVNVGGSVKAIGKNSQASVRGGVILGSAMTLDGLVRRFAAEMKISPDQIDLIATGKSAEDILPNCKSDFTVVGNLTLLGLCYIYQNNLDNNRR